MLSSSILSHILLFVAQAAILRFHGTSWKGKVLKVEEIRDHPKIGRVRVPESMVSYVIGASKPTRDGRPNVMRRIERIEKDDAEKQKKKRSTNFKKKRKKQKLTTSKSSTGDSSNHLRKKKRYRLQGPDQQEFDRACRKGYVTLSSTGFRRGRQSNALACCHRQWCDERVKPQIVLCKASGGRPLDNLIIDLSPLRVVGKSLAGTTNQVDDELIQWKAQILAAASNAGMELRVDYEEDNCQRLTNLDDALECVMAHDNDDKSCQDKTTSSSVVQEDNKSHQGNPIKNKRIEKLPVLSMGVFEGERSKAKAMARELALLWDIPEEVVATENSISPLSCKNDKKPFKNKRRGKDTGRRRRNKEVDFFF